MNRLSDRYEVGDQLGAGGMGRVVSAYDRTLERPVAIKLINDAYANDDGARARLLLEARSAAQLHHPNVVTVFDVGDDGGRLFIVMELVAGRTLATRMRDQGALDQDEVVGVVAALLDGLGAAHDHGIVHRDVKPSNVLLSDDGAIKISDFGIAKAADEVATGVTMPGQVLGTPRYLAPELLSGGPATPASDLYAVGVLAYECLSGRLPFEAATPVAMALAHQRDPVPPLTETAPHVDPKLAAAVERALVKDPADRFASAASMREALPVGASSTPVVAPSTSVGMSTAAEGSRSHTRDSAVRSPAPGDGTVPLTLDGSEDVSPAEGSIDEDALAEVDDTESLLHLLADDPAAVGARGEELVERLDDLIQGAEQRNRSPHANRLSDDVERWVAGGEIDPAVGEVAVRLIGSLE